MLDEIYVDGVVPVPVGFGLQRGLTTIEEWAELVTRGLVRLDVADAFRHRAHNESVINVKSSSFGVPYPAKHVPLHSALRRHLCRL